MKRQWSGEIQTFPKILELFLTRTKIELEPTLHPLITKFSLEQGEKKEKSDEKIKDIGGVICENLLLNLKQSTFPAARDRAGIKRRWAKPGPFR